MDVENQQFWQRKGRGVHFDGNREQQYKKPALSAEQHGWAGLPIAEGAV